MSASEKADWLIPVGLVALGAIPTLAGIFRVALLAVGANVASDDTQYFMAPLPVLLHICGSVVFCVLGAFHFSPGLRRRFPDWQRAAASRALVSCGMVAALAGVWVAQFHPPAIHSPLLFDDPAIDAIRFVAGSAMAMSLCLGFAAIRRRDIPGHRAWILRGCALGLGAAALLVTHVPWYRLPDIQGEVARTLLTAAGWGANLAVAEWSISRGAAARRVRSDRPWLHLQGSGTGLHRNGRIRLMPPEVRRAVVQIPGQHQPRHRSDAGG